MDNNQNKSNKNKIVASVLAVALAASMLIGGGTYAYLRGATDDVVNNFKTNQVSVSLDETTGSQYEIIPGTEQNKDPEVTVDNTVDAYVYVEITDKTDGLVAYEIADGWNALSGFNNVYYKAVGKDEAVKTFSVLKNASVSYSKELENSDMLDENGNLKSGITLAFKAYAIQQAGFESAEQAFTEIPASVSSGDEFAAALKSGRSVCVNNDFTLTDLITLSSGSAEIDLNGKTITFDKNAEIDLLGNADLRVYGNGSINVIETSEWGYIFNIMGNSHVKIENGNYTAFTVVQTNGNSSADIAGGYFSAPESYKYNGWYWFLNQKDDARETSSINVTGGTFVDFNPANCISEGEGTNFVADGYTVSSAADGNSTVYTVSKS
ncbi:MAG: hypothetical protein LUG21_05190 [Clostridiales bacterium]|nr:hypothetical protein [Clostridiales bacterium]